MTLSMSVEEVRDQGRAAAEQIVGAKLERLTSDMASGFEWATIAYPCVTEADLRDMLPKFSKRRLADELDLLPRVGHGLTYQNVRDVVTIPQVREASIGHSIVARSVMVGIEQAVREMIHLLRR